MSIEQKIKADIAQLAMTAHQAGLPLIVAFQPQNKAPYLALNGSGMDAVRLFSAATGTYISQNPQHLHAGIATLFREALDLVFESYGPRRSVVGLRSAAHQLSNDARRSQSALVVAVLDREARSSRVETSASEKRNEGDRLDLASSVLNAQIAELPADRRAAFLDRVVERAKGLTALPEPQAQSAESAQAAEAV